MASLARGAGITRLHRTGGRRGAELRELADAPASERQARYPADEDSMRRLHLLTLAFAMTALAAAPDSDPAPGGILLLAGYQHKHEQGIDSSPGRIWKEGGLVIRYDIGGSAGNYAEHQAKAERVWTRRQVVGDRRVDIVKSKDGNVYVSFASDKDDNRGGYPANFYAAIKKDEDLADLLLIALTYPERSKPAR